MNSPSPRARPMRRAPDDKSLIEPLYRELKARPPPRSGMTLNLLGELAELLERKTDALDWYKQVPEDDEHWFEAQIRSVLLLDGEGKTAEAQTRSTSCRRAPATMRKRSATSISSKPICCTSTAKARRRFSSTIAACMRCPTTRVCFTRGRCSTTI